MSRSGIARRSRHQFHGDPARFDRVAELTFATFPGARYVADVAGGQGMLARLLAKRYGYTADVIDPRGWTLNGVNSRAEQFDASMATYYDVVIGLHPDQALRPVVDAARLRPVIVVPCCNFWDRSLRLGRDALGACITTHHRDAGGTAEQFVLGFSGPYDHALVLRPPTTSDSQPSLR